MTPESRRDMHREERGHLIRLARKHQRKLAWRKRGRKFLRYMREIFWNWFAASVGVAIGILYCRWFIQGC